MGGGDLLGSRYLGRGAQRPRARPDEPGDASAARRRAARHAELALGPTELLRLLVFRSNLGTVRFEPDGDSHTVIHELWSMDGPNETTGSPYTVHRSSLALAASVVRPELEAAADA